MLRYESERDKEYEPYREGVGKLLRSGDCPVDKLGAEAAARDPSSGILIGGGFIRL
jgi:hypothetical protein